MLVPGKNSGWSWRNAKVLLFWFLVIIFEKIVLFMCVQNWTIRRVSGGDSNTAALNVFKSMFQDHFCGTDWNWRERIELVRTTRKWNLNKILCLFLLIGSNHQKKWHSTIELFFRFLTCYENFVQKKKCVSVKKHPHMHSSTIFPLLRQFSCFLKFIKNSIFWLAKFVE